MRKFEYIQFLLYVQVNNNPTPLNHGIEELNALGQKRWEVCAKLMGYSDGATELLLKREIE